MNAVAAQAPNIAQQLFARGVGQQDATAGSHGGIVTKVLGKLLRLDLSDTEGGPFKLDAAAAPLSTANGQTASGLTKRSGILDAILAHTTREIQPLTEGVTTPDAGGAMAAEGETFVSADMGDLIKQAALDNNVEISAGADVGGYMPQGGSSMPRAAAAAAEGFEFSPN